jgi:hypothetical protein
MLTKEIFFKKLKRLNALEEYQKVFDNYWVTESENRLTELLKTSKLYRDVIYRSFFLDKKWLYIAYKIDSIKTNNIYKIKIKIR